LFGRYIVASLARWSKGDRYSARRF